MNPTRIQLSRKSGSKIPPNTVKVDRSTGWGNPFIVGTHGIPDPATAVKKFREWIEAAIADDHPHPECTRAALENLRGKNLACWCALDAPCHADVLLELANRRAPPSPTERLRAIVEQLKARGIRDVKF